jgi:hypothetical protein
MASTCGWRMAIDPETADRISNPPLSDAMKFIFVLAQSKPIISNQALFGRI